MSISRRSCSKLSSVHRGIAFERRALQILQDNFSMSLQHVGGKSDGGIDLAGWWWLPFMTPPESQHTSRVPMDRAIPDPDGILRRRIRVFAQCKAEKKKLSPNHVREMEGVWHMQSHTPPPSSLPSNEAERKDSFPYSNVALLLSESPFSKSTLLRAYQSTVPFLLIHLPITSSPSSTNPLLPSFGDDSSPGNIGAVYPNPTLTDLVSPLIIRWECKPLFLGDVDTPVLTHGRPGLWWQGHRLRSWSPGITENALV